MTYAEKGWAQASIAAEEAREEHAYSKQYNQAVAAAKAGSAIISAALKRQREECAEAWNKVETKHISYKEATQIWHAILNAEVKE